MILIRVVFPHPLGPRIATYSPSSTVRLTLSSAVILPNRIAMSTASILGTSLDLQGRRDAPRRHREEEDVLRRHHDEDRVPFAHPRRLRGKGLHLQVPERPGVYLEGRPPPHEETPSHDPLDALARPPVPGSDPARLRPDPRE